MATGEHLSSTIGPKACVSKYKLPEAGHLIHLVQSRARVQIKRGELGSLCGSLDAKIIQDALVHADVGHRIYAREIPDALGGQ